MNISTVRPCVTPSSAQSGSWLPRWIPQGPPSKTVGKHAFLRCHRWNSTAGISVQNANLTNSTET